MELRDIYAVRRCIRGLVRETPLEPSPFFSDMCGGEVWLKLENQQITGSFKARGALNKLFQLSAEERSRGIVAASSGNHAQGVGYAARMLGVGATIVVPSNTPEVKIEAIRRYGVELVVHGEEYMDAERLARRMRGRGANPSSRATTTSTSSLGRGPWGWRCWRRRPTWTRSWCPSGEAA